MKTNDRFTKLYNEYMAKGSKYFIVEPFHNENLPPTQSDLMKYTLPANFSNTLDVSAFPTKETMLAAAKSFQDIVDKNLQIQRDFAGLPISSYFEEPDGPIEAKWLNISEMVPPEITAVHEANKLAAYEVTERVESWGQKNCATFKVNAKTCSCCVDIEFNGHTHAYNVNEGLENLQTLLYDLVAGNIK